MEFVVALLLKLAQDPGVTLSEAASETYYATLQVGGGRRQRAERASTLLGWASTLLGWAGAPGERTGALAVFNVHMAGARSAMHVRE